MPDGQTAPLADAGATAGSVNEVLAVDDDRMSLFVLEDRIMELGYGVTSASGGQEALDILAKGPSRFEVVLLDRMMPGIDGLDVVKRMASDPALKRIPVVMITGADSAQDMREGIDAGVFHYLAKPVDKTLLRSVLSAAQRQAALSRSLSDGADGETAAFDNMIAAKFQFRTIQDAEILSGFLANCFPDPEGTLSGIAALLINAVEHGICEIGYELKGKLLDDGALADEITRRLEQSDKQELWAEAAVTRRDGGVYLVVTDPGPGFVWRDFLQIDPSRASTSHGRGIAQAYSSCFDKLTYNDAGNKAVAFASRAEIVKW